MQHRIIECSLCKEGVSLYKCPTCGAIAHINVEKKEMVIHFPPLKLPTVEALRPPVSVCFPSHFDCELSKPVDQIDLNKLVKVEVK